MEPINFGLGCNGSEHTHQKPGCGITGLNRDLSTEDAQGGRIRFQRHPSGLPSSYLVITPQGQYTAGSVVLQAREGEVGFPWALALGGEIFPSRSGKPPFISAPRPRAAVLIGSGKAV